MKRTLYTLDTHLQKDYRHTYFSVGHGHTFAILLLLIMSVKPKVIDLFSGVGGLSLSAARSGFKVCAAVEKEHRIMESHKTNFPEVRHICEDVSTLDPKQLAKTAKVSIGELAGLIGGPPCQGFSVMGRQNLADERNNLFQHFYKLVAQLRPAFFLAENVPGIMSVKYQELRTEAEKYVIDTYDLVEPLVIKASDFGAPTIRTRVFFIGVRKDVKGVEKISNAIENEKLVSPVYVKEALFGLPETISEEWLDFKSSWQQLNDDYNNNYTTTLNRYIEGIGCPISINRFKERREISGCFGTRHTLEVATRYASLRSGTGDKISKSIKLDPAGFCPTLRAGTDVTRGSFQAVRPIHPTQARVITPREAARLQGFPDWFQFHETKWHSFRQIGNSVSPLAAEKVLNTIRKSLSI